MNAVILSGGKQYRVTEGQTLKLEKLPQAVGDIVAFEQVLLMHNGDNVNLGNPFIPGAKVIGEVIGQGRRKKISVIKMRRRKHYLRRQGHRQDYTEVKITEIKSS
jgi:large subunit ribosomal protein L21